MPEEQVKLLEELFVKERVYCYPNTGKDLELTHKDAISHTIASLQQTVEELEYTVKKEAAENNCVYRNEIQHPVGERTQFLQDVAADPTLPRTKSVQCSQCKHGEAVFFQATARGEEGMTLFFVCCNPNCGHRWRD
ncbi:Dna-directed rna polymerase subunit [Thalictrum thalictroides]|uniref:Dna-directed rna polymerase subunit n=1 Tax=Thalictrum thalictroides TaxID=46969 RepID=A0A7J6W5U2_THATH|nr:Dna-directed rna polymerase subunit [Thalictrum thalictroides]